eukprot:CAMPEP_0119352072 /NCGR_PEP_ID=MMETSP1334-20130426/1369_1 /TAXON_ID=127549 /ORGANISM="Calcidiscus leptoporus, Strain RCC1130" /LENGTH=37 /DNA_ID= /DNA_START= /DNA_END= /DNA_ORIENTATION=
MGRGGAQAVNRCSSTQSAERQLPARVSRAAAPPSASP